MRRSSVYSEGGPLGPQRVKQDGGSVTKQRSRLSVAGGSTGFGSRLKSMGGTSSANKNRHVSIVRGYGNDTMKDPRPVTDRSFKEKNIRALVQFLMQTGYPHPVNPKLLASPSGKEFFRIFEFMYSCVDPKFKVGKKKIEEEVPILLKHMGYPVPISKSAMHSVGTPHVWPTLLAALSWLRQHIENFCEIDSEMTMFPELDGQLEEDLEGKLLHVNTLMAYRKFMSGSDSYEEADADLERQIRQNKGGRDLKHLQQENKSLQATLQVLQEEPDHLLSRKELLSNLETDVHKLQNYVTHVDQAVEKQEQVMHGLTMEYRTLEEEKNSLLSENQRMQKIFELQEFSQADVQRINMERGELQRQIDALQQENNEIDDTLWKEEMNIAKMREKLESKCLEYNKTAQTLQLVPITAQNAYGIDYELRINMGAKAFEATTKQALNQLRMSCQDKLQKLEEQHLLENHALEQLNELQAEKESSLNAVNTKLRRTEEMTEAKKQVQQTELKVLEEETEVLHEEVATLRLTSAAHVRECQKKLALEKAQADKNHLVRVEEFTNYTDFLKDAMTMLTDHKSEIQDHCNKVRNQVRERCAGPLPSQ